MRKRLPLFLACLMIFPALLVAGCGDDISSDSTKAPDTAAPTPVTSDSATSSSQATLDACIDAADKLPDEDQAMDAKELCQESHDNIEDANKKIDEKTEEAVEQCKDAAEKIPDADAKANALAACGKFQ